MMHRTLHWHFHGHHSYLIRKCFIHILLAVNIGKKFLNFKMNLFRGLWSTRTFLQLVLWSARTFSLVDSYFFLWSTRAFLKIYLRYAMFLYHGTPWTFNMILRLLKEHKSAHISVFFTHWRVKSLLVDV